MSNQCIHCKRDTSFGSGLFVNRIPADDGYICPECGAYTCDRCGKPIAIDEDIGTEEVFGNSDYHPFIYSIGKSLSNEFSDGSWKVHEECLTREEQELLILNDTELRSFQKEFLMKEIAEKYKGEK